MMTGPLLRSGSLAEQRPLGQEGHPVYRFAPQLREAIRLQLGAQAADCLAIPQPNESGEWFDWYAPFDGDRVPWTAASQEERARAYEELKKVQARLVALSASLQQQEDAVPGKDDRERRTFSRLLGDVIRFPGPEYVYLVNGKPVVTFWGFDDNIEPGMDSLERLRSTPATAAPPPDDEPEVKAAPVAKPRRRWWWWLLLPLLLLLALLLLYVLRHPRHDLVGVDSEKTQHIAPSPDEEVPVTRPLSDEPVPVPGVLVPDGGDVGSLGAEAGVPAPAQPGDPGTTPGGNEPGAAPPGPMPQAGQAADQPAVDRAPGPQPAESPGEGPLHNLPPKSAPSPTSGMPQGEPLVIPQEAMQNGSTGFLDGKWRAATGLQEARSGQPVNLEYDFQRGQGQVSIRQADGTVCRGVVAASMTGQQLRLSDRSAPVCPNGVRYRPAQVTCQPGKDGIAVCTGSYPDGRRFAVNMRRVEE